MEVSDCFDGYSFLFFPSEERHVRSKVAGGASVFCCFSFGVSEGFYRVRSICFKRPFESMAVSVISARALRAMARTVFLSVSVVEDLSGWVIVHDP